MNEASDKTGLDITSPEFWQDKFDFIKNSTTELEGLST